MIILYTSHCPKCTVLEAKLKQANIDYKICEDEEVFKEKGFMSMPMLETDDGLFDFMKAIAWLGQKPIDSAPCEGCRV